MKLPRKCTCHMKFPLPRNFHRKFPKKWANPMRWVSRLLSNNNDMKSQAWPRNRIGDIVTSVEPSFGEQVDSSQLLPYKQKWLTLSVLSFFQEIAYESSSLKNEICLRFIHYHIYHSPGHIISLGIELKALIIQFQGGLWMNLTRKVSCPMKSPYPGQSNRVLSCYLELSKMVTF